MEVREINECIVACGRVLASIEVARRELNSAQNWGWFDILGGGFITSLIKRNKMSRAETSMGDIQTDLRNLQRELRDVSPSLELALSTQDLNMVFDIFFDNIFSDLVSQNKIKTAQTELNELEEDIVRLQSVLGEMKAAIGR